MRRKLHLEYKKGPRKGRKIRYAHRVPRDREKLAKRQINYRCAHL